MSKLIDLTGQRFDRLIVLGRAEDKIYPGGQRATRWSCLCDCGAKTIANAYDLRSGQTKSCGCYHGDLVAERNFIHGHRHCRQYNIWSNMLQRCGNPQNKDYEYYGGRGISVCKEWVHDFEAFYQWSLANGYAPDLTIDRIDNNAGYSPGNCHWVTMEKQNKNKRKPNNR